MATLIALMRLLCLLLLSYLCFTFKTVPFCFQGCQVLKGPKWQHCKAVPIFHFLFHFRFRFASASVRNCFLAIMNQRPRQKKG